MSCCSQRRTPRRRHKNFLRSLGKSRIGQSPGPAPQALRRVQSPGPGGGGCLVASDIERGLEALRKINDQSEESVERIGVSIDRLQELVDEYLRIDEDEKQLLTDLEALGKDEADRAGLQLEARGLRERREQLAEEISHAVKGLEEVVAEAQTLRTGASEEMEKLRSVGTEIKKMHFETAKHLTTLNTAAILVYLAAGGEVSLPLWVALLFVLSLASATVSMVATGSRWTSDTPSGIGIFALGVAIAGFLSGLVYSVLHALIP
jgi:FtsZ-binding cell division protein ZapB